MKKFASNKAKKKVPSYWWDFAYKDDVMIDKILVECDNNKTPILAVISHAPYESYKAQNEACLLISDLEAGRKKVTKVWDLNLKRIK